MGAAWCSLLHIWRDAPALNWRGAGPPMDVSGEECCEMPMLIPRAICCLFEFLSTDCMKQSVASLAHYHGYNALRDILLRHKRFGVRHSLRHAFKKYALLIVVVMLEVLDLAACSYLELVLANTDVFRDFFCLGPNLDVGHWLLTFRVRSLSQTESISSMIGNLLLLYMCSLGK